MLVNSTGPEPSAEILTDAAQAAAVYDLQLRAPSALAQSCRWLIVLVSHWFTAGAGLAGAGGYRAVVSDRQTGRQLAVYVEQMDDIGAAEFAQLIDDYRQRSAEEFRREWLPTDVAIDATRSPVEAA